ncbi:MAG TPA: MFS transporter [Alphaproteobacteria bacterium]|nr:MFS transporter [Alphaproteobacteria bacterium]
MLQALPAVASLLVGVALLMLGSGLLGLVLPIRLSTEAVATSITGLVMSGYYAGLVLGALYGKLFIARVGHIRAFAAFAALVSSGSLAHALWFDPWVWMGLRVLSGFCMATLFAAIESWLNEKSGNESRGQVLSLYMITSYVAMGSGQLLVNLWDVDGFESYCLIAILITLSLVPVTLTRVAGPEIATAKPLSFAQLYEISPVGVLGSFSSGLIQGGFYALAAIFGRAIGMSIFEVSLFVGSAVFGGLLLQWPIGRLSDRFDRRTVLFWVLVGTTLIAAAQIGLTRFGGDFYQLLLLTALYGGAATAVYPISVSHAYDYVERDRLVSASSGLLLSYAIGATAGPLIAAALMQALQPTALFAFIGVVTGTFSIFVLYRQRHRAALPSAEQATFVPLPTTTPVVTELDPRCLPAEAGTGSQEA